MAWMILITLLACPLAAWLGRRRARWAQLLAAWPLCMTVWAIHGVRSALAGEVIRDQVDWIPGLGLSLTFRLDGLSSIFVLLITGVGACVVLYAAHYFDGHADAGRFQATLFAFMAAMLGVVSTDNLFALFVFWELTGFTSYLLIGFEHDDAVARRSALQALLVTGAGGLGLLAGAVLLFQAAGTPSLYELMARATSLKAHPVYTPSVLCVLLAAFSKSAQFPFHFWLPSAMAAPTPVSAYLHSATMVKAGVYLVARLTPTLGGTELWSTLVIATGGVTMLGAAWRAVQETDLKRILAYSTASSLGTLMVLLGLGTPSSIAAALAYLVAHGCYKGSLFFLAGIVDHEAGTRDITKLGGLSRVMPLSAAAGTLAAASMAGLPPLLGFVVKEEMYTAVLDQSLWPYSLAAALLSSGALLGAAGLLAGVAPFAGSASSNPERAHDPGCGLWLSPLFLGILGLGGVFSGFADPLSSLATSAVVGKPVAVELSLWHGWSYPLLLSAVSVALMLLVYRGRRRLRHLALPHLLRTERLYDAALRTIEAASARLAPPLQDASLTAYVMTFTVSTGMLIGATLLMTEGAPVPERMLFVQVHEVLLALLVVGATFGAVRARSTMAAVLSLGAAGYGVALIFLLYGAPDLALTMFAVETLTVVIFVFVFWQLPRTAERTSPRAKRRDALISIAFGALVSVLTLATATHPTNSRLRNYFATATPTLAHGRNIVNLLLVDFRALDTLGEITVLATAALGVSALLRIAAEQRRKP